MALRGPRTSCRRSDRRTVRPSRSTFPVGAGTYHALYPVCLVRRRLGRAPGAGRAAPVQPGPAGQLPRVELPGRRVRDDDREPLRPAGDRRADAHLAERAGPGRGTGSRRRAAARGGSATTALPASCWERPARRPGPRTTARSRCSAPAADGVELTTAPLFRVDDAGRLWADFADDGRLRRRGPDDGRRAGRSGGRRRGRGHDPARARRVADDPVRPGLGPPRRGVRGRDALASPLHVVLRDVGPERPGDRRDRLARADVVVGGDRRLAGALPGGRGTAGLVRVGALQRAVLHGRRRDALDRRPADARRRLDADARGRSRRGRPVRAVRPDRVLRLSLLQHARRRLLRVVRPTAAVAGARAGGHPRVRRRGRRPRPGDRRDPVERQAGDPQVPGRAAARRRRPRGRPVPPRQRLPLPGHQHLEGPELQVRPPGLARRDASSATTRCYATRGRGS